MLFQLKGKSTTWDVSSCAIGTSDQAFSLHENAEQICIKQRVSSLVETGCKQRDLAEFALPALKLNGFCRKSCRELIGPSLKKTALPSLGARPRTT